MVAPHEPHDLYGLFDGADGLAGAPARAVHGDHGVPEGAGAEAHLYPAPGEHVEAGGGLGEHGRRAQGQVGHVGEEADALGYGNERRDERPGVEEAPLVWMILDADEVEAGPVGGPRGARGPVRGVCQRLHAHAELEVPAVVRHGVSFPVVLLRPNEATNATMVAALTSRNASEKGAASRA